MGQVIQIGASRAVGLRAGHPRVGRRRVGQPGLFDNCIRGLGEHPAEDVTCEFLIERRGGICGQNRKPLGQLK